VAVVSFIHFCWYSNLLVYSESLEKQLCSLPLLYRLPPPPAAARAVSCRSSSRAASTCSIFDCSRGEGGTPCAAVHSAAGRAFATGRNGEAPACATAAALTCVCRSASISDGRGVGVGTGETCEKHISFLEFPLCSS
jgi:hypothetical protein